MLTKIQSLIQRLRQAMATLKQNPHTPPKPDRTERPRRPSIFTLDKRLVFEIEAIAAEDECTPEEIAHTLLQDGIHRRRAADAWLTIWNSLTPREKQAAGLTCLGYTNEQIAKEMTISPNTVKTYVKKILVRFKVNSKSELRDLLADWDFSEWLKGSLGNRPN